MTDFPIIGLESRGMFFASGHLKVDVAKRNSGIKDALMRGWSLTIRRGGQHVAVLLLLYAIPCCTLASAQSLQAVILEQGLQCRKAIDRAEQVFRIPDHLLDAIGRVESGRWDPIGGAMHPWPWTINAEGQDGFFETKEQAVSAVRALQARGVNSIDVGCMQVNLMYHAGAFASLEQAFDPPSNALYAANFLSHLHMQTNDWAQAAALYHSATPDLGAEYQRRVLAILPQESSIRSRVRAEMDRVWLAEVWAATLPGRSRPAQTSTFLSSRPRSSANATTEARRSELRFASNRGAVPRGLSRLHANN